MKDDAAEAQYPIKIHLAESAHAIIINVQKLNNFLKIVELFSPKSEFNLKNM